MLHHNLKTELLRASEIQIDHRFKNWAKIIDSVDTSKRDGYMYNGRYINDGTIELEPRRYVILCAAQSGSRAYNYYQYQVLILHPNGEIEKTDVEDDEKQNGRGWALRLRDGVIALLEQPSVDPLPDYSSEFLLSVLRTRGVIE